jgi:hypothetical protein
MRSLQRFNLLQGFYELLIRIMKKEVIIVILCLYTAGLSLIACTKKTNGNPILTPTDTGLVNTSHLDHLYIPVTFPDAVHAAGIYIYSQYPDYHPVEASGEGFTCVDDVSRAALVYLRSSKFSSDTAIQTKLYNLLQFVLEMQSANGYFYNFLFSNNSINTAGLTSINNSNWWSWRALQTLTEAGPVIKTKNAQLYSKMEAATNKLVAQIKVDLVNLPPVTTIVNGITVPQWLPAGSGADQSAVLVLGLINYCLATNDAVITAYIQKLADASFTISSNAGAYQILTENKYDQIAYGIEPMVFAAAEAYKETGQDKYANLAGHLAAWLLGANDAGVNMYSSSTGICYDALSSASRVNLNSGAESTIEALLTLEKVENYPAIKAALNRYKKH